MLVGIDRMNAYCGRIALNIQDLFKARDLDISRFDNLMMNEKSLNLPWEDSVTNAVNAAKPLLDKMSFEERDRIELVIVATESGLDFGKSLATFIHPYLGLSNRCRLFEVKQACYAGTAALQMAVHWVHSNASVGSKALVIATDCARSAIKMTYAEPSQGVAAVAMLISSNPRIFSFDIGATGYHSYDVFDTCRPEIDIETGDADLSLLSYLDCLEKCYLSYCSKVDNVDIKDTFSHFVFHTPFAGMVKGAHRSLIRKNIPGVDAEYISNDFIKRVEPSLYYSQKVGNVYSASVYLALCSLIDHIELFTSKRIGIYSYGSGCSSEFYSGVLQSGAHLMLKEMSINAQLNSRLVIDMATYDNILAFNKEVIFGTKNKIVNTEPFQDIYQNKFNGKGLLTLNKIESYKRQYAWS